MRNVEIVLLLRLARTLHKISSRSNQGILWFLKTKVSDAKELTNWLAEQALIYELKFEQLKLAAVARLRNLKLEPPTYSRLDVRLI